MAAEEDHPSNPGTAPFVPDFDDTTSQPVPEPRLDESEAERAAETPPPDVGEPESAAIPVTVPGRYQFLKWWKLALVVIGVWVAATEVGLSLFYWWYHTSEKTAAVFTALVYVVACTVAAVMLAMVEGRPMLSALSIALMSGPFASLSAAAPLYSHYHCMRVSHCVLGLIPF